MTNLCNLLESKMEKMSSRQKAEIFIGTIHIQQDPVFSMMYKIIDKIPDTEFALAVINFLRNYDAMLVKAPKAIEITEEGLLTLYFKNIKVLC